MKTDANPISINIPDKTSSENIPKHQVRLSRPALSSSDWDDRYHRVSDQPSSTGSLIKDFGRLTCKDFNWKTFFLSFLPIVSWLPKYNWKTNFINDLVAGFTVAVMHIPQVSQNWVKFYLFQKISSCHKIVHNL